MLERKRRVQVDIRIFRGRITQSGNDELLRVNYSLVEAHYRSQWGSKGPCNTSSLSRLSRFIAAGFFFFFFFLPFFEEMEGEAFLFLPNLPWTVPQLRAGRKMGGRRCRLSRHFSALPGYPTAETCPVIGSWSSRRGRFSTSLISFFFFFFSFSFFFGWSCSTLLLFPRS